MTRAEQMLPENRGYFVPYRIGEPNSCPGCGRSHWWLGRSMAECAFCTTALDLPVSAKVGGGLIKTRKGNGPWQG